MTRRNPFDPSNWYSGSSKKKPQKKNESLSDTVDDSMRGIGKLAVAGAGLTLLFGMTKGFSQMFKR